MGSADRTIRAQLVLGGLRWRAGASLSMFLVAVAAIAAGTFGPVYLTEADHSVLLSTIASASVGNTGLTLLPATGPDSGPRLRQATQVVAGAFGGRSYFGPSIDTETLGNVSTKAANGQLYGSDLVARTGICGHLSFRSGHCPVSTAEVAMSTRSAHALGLRLGQRMTLQIPKSQRPVTLTIAGLFRPGDPRAAIWWGQNFFAFGFGTPMVPLLDDFFASPSTVVAAAPAGQASVMSQLPLVPEALTPGNVTTFENTLSAVERRTRSGDDVGASTGVGAVLADAAHDEHTTNTIVIVVDLQLVLLSLLILYFVAARTAEVREPDVRLAELRGFGRTDTAAVALLEPLTVLGLAVPVGIAVAWVAARLGTAHLFVAGVTPGIGILAVAAALLSFAAGVVATVLGARRLVQRRGTGHGSKRDRPTTIAVDAVAVTLAAVAFVEVAAAGVSSGSHTDPLAAFAPGLLAFGVGVVFARLLPVASRLAIAPTRNSRWVGATVAVRRVARRVELSRHVVLMALAIGLATFAIAGWSVAGHNRTLQADFDVGAAHALVVQPRPGVNLLAAVRRADPTGKKAMAVVIEKAPDGTLLAVDAARLADVSAWPSTLSPRSIGSIARLIAPPTAPAVVVSGRALRVSVDVATALPYPPQLEAVVFDDAFQTLTTLDLGPLLVAQHTYQAAITGDCAGSCRLVSLGMAWTPPDTDPTETVSFPLVITAIADQATDGSWSTVKAGLRSGADWTGEPGGTGVSPHASGLAVHAYVPADGAAATFAPADVPKKLPAVVTVPGAMSVGLDGATITVKNVDAVAALPVIGNGNSATMVDLPLVERLQSGPMLYATAEVWLAPGPDGAIEHRLQGEGITVEAVRSVTARVAQLSKSGVSLAYALFLLAAIAAAVLAVGATGFAVSVTARRRTVELASLRAVGIEQRSLRRALALEQFLVLGVGVVAGALAGVIAAAVALPSIPENFSSGPGAPPDFALPFVVIGVILLAVIVALGITVAVADRVVVGRATAEKLGGEQ